MIIRDYNEAAVVLAALALLVRTYNKTATGGLAREAVETANDMLLRTPGGYGLLNEAVN